MASISRSKLNLGLLGSAFFVLAACEQPLDFDLRSLGGGFSTTDAARQATLARPTADDRGVISYPNYQVAIARTGDRIGDVAARVGIPADELGRYNGITPDAVLRADEVIALPQRVSEPSPATGAIGTGPILPQNDIDIGTLAGDAIDRAGTTPPAAAPDDAQTGSEPIRHQVKRGETAFSISRLYDVPVRSLSEWNGLGPDLAVRAGQYLLIPVATQSPPSTNVLTAPGVGSPTPAPPSASTALPDDDTGAATQTPASPNLAENSTTTSALAMPTNGPIILAYSKGTNEGINIAAPAGSDVRAAADGSVAAITLDTDQVPIIVLRHDGNMLTVYAGVDGLTVKKGDKVQRGQKIAVVRAGNPSFLHFEVRQGLNSVDPMQFLN